MANTPYQQCLSDMYGLRRFGIKLGLDNIKTLLAGMGEPQRQFPIIHIAGTNGKGSVASMLSSVLHTAGYRVGKYTSPHLERFNERICIDGTPIDDDAVIAAYDKARNVKGFDRESTFFEFTTAMALYEFARQNVDWAIIETGMGGRLDATNVVQPELTIITNISLEHRQYLGHTIASIASEKAGIIKPGVAVVTGVTQESAKATIYRIAAKGNSPVYLKGRNFRTRRQGNESFSYLGMNHTWRGLQLGLSGDHQIDNAALVLAACEILRDTQQLDISFESITRGLENTCWPGRLEVVTSKPRIILDGAHNLMAVRTLVRYLKSRYQNSTITLVVGVLDDKPCDTILKELIAPCQRVVVTQPDIDRAIPVDKLIETARKYNPRVDAVAHVGRAVEHAVKTSSPEDVICIAGSLYVVGEAKTELRRMSLTSGP